MSESGLERVKEAIDGLRRLMELLPVRLLAITNEKASAKRSAETWSQKQELGHLIDSAENNHQRIVRAQLKDGLAMPDYEGDRWVELHGYEHRDWRELIELWQAGNRQLLAAAASVPDTAWSHRLTIGDTEQQTLGFVIVDYLRHMSWHLRHIGIDVEGVPRSKPSDAIVYPEKPAAVEYSINGLMIRRWSPRAFEQSRAVERVKILAMLEAARWAPSCFNDQPRFFLVFDGSDAAVLERARGCLSEGNGWALKAPVLMLSVTRETFEKNGKPNRWAQHDVGLATENLLLEAVELGLAAHPMAGYDAGRARSEFEIPEGYTPIAMIAIGYPYRGRLEDLDDRLRTRELEPRQRKPIGEMAFSGKWGVAYPRG